MKTCEFCQESLFRKRKPCGKLEANISFSKRRFCNSQCRGNFTASKNQCLENSARQRTLKLFPKESLTCCEVCGDFEKRLHRHHKDKNTYNNLPENILICCQNCHAKEHQKIGTWGTGKKQRICISCHQIFTHENRRRKTCSDVCFLKICSSKATQRWTCGQA
jgi:hypothetical protein